MKSRDCSTIVLIFLTACFGVHAQNKAIPSLFLKSFQQLKLDKKYQINGYSKPGFLLSDFNGDGIEDAVFQVIERKTLKKGIIVLFGNSTQYFVFGAGTKVGTMGFDDTDDLKWMGGWKIFKQPIAYETKFDNGDIVGSIKRKLVNKGISLWSIEDGEPLAGGIIYWNGKKWVWIHQGE